MSSLKKHFFLSLFPVFMVIISFILGNVKGYYWFWWNFDPDYAYLLAGLRMAVGELPVFHDHPGIPVQLYAAVMLRAIYFVRDIFHPTQGFVQDVLVHPDMYLLLINRVLIILIGALLYLSGIVLYRIMHNVSFCVLLQFIPFFSARNVLGLTKLSPEPFLLMAGLLFALSTIVIAHRQYISNSHVLFLSFVVAFGMSSKLLFLPFAIIPLFVIREVRLLAKYVGLSLGFFILLTLPVMYKYPLMFAWLMDLMGHSGLYGHGANELFNVTTYGDNLLHILSTNMLYFFVWLVVFLFMLMNRFTTRLRVISKDRYSLRILTGILVAQLLGVFMIAKHFAGNHYMISLYCLTGLSLAVIIVYLKQVNNEFRVDISRTLRYFVALIILIFLLKANSYANLYAYLVNGRNETLHFIASVKMEYPGQNKIYYNRASSKQLALSFANIYNDCTFSEELWAAYADFYFYDKVNKTYSNWCRSIEPQRILESDGDVLFIGTPLSEEEMPEHMKLTPLLTGKEEVVYTMVD